MPRIFQTRFPSANRTDKHRGILAVQSRQGKRQLWEYNNYLKVKGVKEPIVQGIARDMTERWQAERALRKSEEKYRQLTETAQDFILSLDLTGKPTYVNQAALSASGYSLAEARQMNIADILSKENLPQMVEMFISGEMLRDVERCFGDIILIFVFVFPGT